MQASDKWKINHPWKLYNSKSHLQLQQLRHVVNTRSPFEHSYLAWKSSIPLCRRVEQPLVDNRSYIYGKWNNSRRLYKFFVLNQVPFFINTPIKFIFVLLTAHSRVQLTIRDCQIISKRHFFQLIRFKEKCLIDLTVLIDILAVVQPNLSTLDSHTTSDVNV